MAKIEQDREDLMKEAVALVRRIEFAPTNRFPSIIAGFRNNGLFSLYLGPDPMFQFDTSGRLRRAFCGGLLYRTQGMALAQLRRERSSIETTLMRRDLAGVELEQFRSHTLSHVFWLNEQLTSASLAIVRQIPGDDVGLLDDIRHILRQILDSQDFLAPAIPGKS